MDTYKGLKIEMDMHKMKDIVSFKAVWIFLILSYVAALFLSVATHGATIDAMALLSTVSMILLVITIHELIGNLELLNVFKHKREDILIASVAAIMILLTIDLILIYGFVLNENYWQETVLTFYTALGVLSILFFVSVGILHVLNYTSFLDMSRHYEKEKEAQKCKQFNELKINIENINGLSEKTEKEIQTINEELKFASINHLITKDIFDDLKENNVRFENIIKLYSTLSYGQKEKLTTEINELTRVLSKKILEVTYKYQEEKILEIKKASSQMEKRETRSTNMKING